MKILSIVGARPNFMKIAPLHRAFLMQPAIESKILHTGQHYDVRLSAIFFDQLNLPHPDYYLGIGPGTPTEQTAEIMLKVESVLRVEQPDWVLVVGDVTSTMACALAAAQAGVNVAHVEAGLRSGDRHMPEERNRILTDALADLLFVTEQTGVDNLRREGVADGKIKFVGNVLIDSLVQNRQKASALDTVTALGLRRQNYILLTMHRPVNVDSEVGLKLILQLVREVAQCKTVLFPIHPRTHVNLVRHNLMNSLAAMPNVRLLEPQGYLEFLNLLEHAAVVITDSGGVQEETTYLQVPCLTFRNSTERPATVDLGTNQLLTDLNPETVRQKVTEILAGQAKAGQVPPLWDGQAAERIVETFLTL
ncbi:non-hydrolyzing UDP-N-acetylglucosamine 2-epimerase [Spirosoma areae]